jgi:hypothetical protein
MRSVLAATAALAVMALPTQAEPISYFLNMTLSGQMFGRDFIDAECRLVMQTHTQSIMSLGGGLYEITGNTQFEVPSAGTNVFLPGVLTLIVDQNSGELGLRNQTFELLRYQDSFFETYDFASEVSPAIQFADTSFFQGGFTPNPTAPGFTLTGGGMGTFRAQIPAPATASMLAFAAALATRRRAR